MCKLGLNNILFLDRVSMIELPELLSAADISIVAQSSSSAHLSMPSKVINYLSAGSAILALTTNTSDLANLVKKNKLGFVCNPKDINQIKETILFCQNNPSHIIQMKKNARDIALRQFSFKVVQQQFTDVFTKYLF